MFGIDVETLSKLIGGVLGAMLLAIVGKVGISSRKTNDTEPPPPAAMGIVLDGDTALAIRDTLRTILANQERFHAEEDRRREANEKRGLENDILALRRQNEDLKRGQVFTHENQADLIAMLRQILDVPGVAEERLMHQSVRARVTEHRDETGD